MTRRSAREHGAPAKGEGEATRVGRVGEGAMVGHGQRAVADLQEAAAISAVVVGRVAHSVAGGRSGDHCMEEKTFFDCIVPKAEFNSSSFAGVVAHFGG